MQLFENRKNNCYHHEEKDGTIKSEEEVIQGNNQAIPYMVKVFPECSLKLVGDGLLCNLYYERAKGGYQFKVVSA